MSGNVTTSPPANLWAALRVFQHFGIGPMVRWGDIHITRARWGTTLQGPQRLARRVADVAELDAAIQVLLRWSRPMTPPDVLLGPRADEALLTLPGDPQIPGGPEWLRVVQQLDTDVDEIVRFTTWLSFLSCLGEDWRQGGSSARLLTAWRTGCFRREKDHLNGAFVWLEGSTRIDPEDRRGLYGVDEPLCALCMGWPRHAVTLTGRDEATWAVTRARAWLMDGVWLQTTRSARVTLVPPQVVPRAPVAGAPVPAPRKPVVPQKPPMPTQPPVKSAPTTALTPHRPRPRRGPSPTTLRLTESDTWAVRVLMCTTTPQHLWNKIGALDPVDVQVVSGPHNDYRVLVPDLTVWAQTRARIPCEHPAALRAYRKLVGLGESTMLPLGVDSLVVLLAHQNTSPVEAP